jgi:aspartyl-tRNA synthetase
MQRINNLETISKIGEDVKLIGWVDSIRDHGNLVFIDLRDRTSLIQLVVFRKELIPAASALSVEDLVEIAGEVQKRPDKLVNADLATGTVEIGVKEITVVSSAAPIPFELNNDTRGINELTRLKYRYLDLRTVRMANNLKMRHEINLFFRNYLSEKGFWEVETPSLTKGTPEGAREFVVPSRLQEGHFYVLPQSPQQYKQLLMVSGVEKYYQIARCFRDEDQRGDRQPEFTQLDMEMSFVEQEDILNLMENMLIALVEKHYPEHHIATKPFPRMMYADAIKQYNSDKPDIRKDKTDPHELAFLWVIDFPLFERSETEKKLVSSHHPFTMPMAEDLDMLEASPEKVRANAFDIVLNGSEVGGGSIRIFQRELQEKVFDILGVSKDDMQSRFGHMLEAFKFSPPPHGGIALGLDRLITILQGETSIREVIAFPKTGDARDPLTGAPTELPDSILHEAHIEVKHSKKK